MMRRKVRLLLRRRFVLPFFFFSCTQIDLLIESFFFNKAKAEEEEEEEEADAAALPKIELGGSLPSVTLKNEKGEDIQVADLAAEKGVILFLVPKADTRTPFFALVYRCSNVPFFFFPAGCTNQACGFRDIYPDFTSLNFDVYCLSADSPTAQTKWQTKVDSSHFVQVPTY